MVLWNANHIYFLIEFACEPLFGKIKVKPSHIRLTKVYGGRLLTQTELFQ